MSRNPKFDAYLENMREIHDKKNSDYADDANPYSNFEGAARIAGVTVDTVFHVLLGVKMERLRQLVSGKEPNFESLDDTVLDLANYAALWGSYRAEEPVADEWLSVGVGQWYRREWGDDKWVPLWPDPFSLRDEDAVFSTANWAEHLR
jgi:hypothetical protein